MSIATFIRHHPAPGSGPPQHHYKISTGQNLKRRRRCAAFLIEETVDVRRIAEFIVFLKERVNPNLIRKFLAYPMQINRGHSFTLFPTYRNAPYVEALSVIARGRDACSKSASAPEALPHSCSDALLYTAFHQFFETKQYIGILTAEKAATEDIMNAAKFARVVAKADAAKATTEIATLAEDSVQSASPVDAVATDDAKRRRTDALDAETVATTTLRLHENYVSNYLIHDIERTRDAIKHRHPHTMI